MKNHACGAAVCRHLSGTIEFLAVKSKSFGHWGFSQGHMEDGESEEETAKREVLEETGLNIALLSVFKMSKEYSPEKGILKEEVYFIGRSLGEDVSIQQEEIQDYKWLDYDKMLELLTFDNDKNVLTEVKDIIG